MSVPDYFAILGVPVGFKLDSALLDSQYRKQQAIWHPDRFVNGSASERMQALQQTSLLNDGYSILKHPLRRAEHLLDIQGGEASTMPALKLDAGFLLQQLELREELEQLGRQRDDAGFANLRKVTAASLAQEWQQFTAELGKQDWCNARLCLQKLQFLHKLQEELNHLEDRWLDS